LIDQRYTSAAHLSGQGGSAGGILIGNAIVDRPDLFGAAIINVGSNDPLRAETTANGVPNIPEFGSFKTEAGFKVLLAMDPLLAEANQLVGIYVAMVKRAREPLRKLKTLVSVSHQNRVIGIPSRHIGQAAASKFSEA
jgi:hypothetical protein